MSIIKHLVHHIVINQSKQILYLRRENICNNLLLISTTYHPTNDSDPENFRTAMMMSFERRTENIEINEEHKDTSEHILI